MVMAINTSRPPLNDLRVRQAINYAIDKQAALDVAYGGGEVVGTFMDYNDPYYVDFTDIYPYDPDRARQLVQETGVGNVELEIALPQIYDPHVRAGELYQEMLERVGFNVKLKLVDWSTWLSEVYTAANYDLTVIGHTGKLDPDGRLSGYGTGASYVRWQSPETAALIRQAARTGDVAERKALYARVLENMAREVPHVYVGTSYRYIATRSNVSGFRMDVKLDTFDFRYTEKR
jgi:peptide/nickel transport system substrate-binding protein